MKRILILSLLFITAVLAPLNKIVKSSQNKLQVSLDTESSLVSNIPGLINLGTVPAANTGPYTIRGYRHPTCPGSIAILPLYRNAEGSHILRKKINNNRLRFGFLVNGKIYSTFPQFTFAFQKTLTAFLHLTTNTVKAPPALAFAEKGQCQLAEKIVRYTL